MDSEFLPGRSNQRAFTLIELSISISIIAIMMSGALTLMSDFAVKHEAVNAQTDLKEIEDALIAYKDRNGRLPCPASQTVLYGSANYGREVNSGVCSYTVAPAGTTRVETAASSGIWVLSGAVPVRDLLLRDAYLKDGFGDRISYSVPQALANASTFNAGNGVITIKNRAANDIATDAAFTLVAHGIDGKGAYREGSGALKVACGASTNLDVENCDGDTTFTDAPYNDGQVTASYYDDTILWKSKVDIVNAVLGPSFTGFRIDGYASGAQSGYSVATGDINGDGYRDVIIGSYQTNHGYVVFGSASGIETPLDSLVLNGTNGFRMTGIGYMAQRVASGDINGDGFDDIIVSALWSTNAFVVFGKASGWTATIDVDTYNDGTKGFQLVGPFGGGIGTGSASGDINGDGIDDVVISAPTNDAGGTDKGTVYVVYGKTSGWAGSVDVTTLNASTGITWNGAANNEFAGTSVATGNINNDAYDDVIIGAPGGNSDAGYTYVVFGKTTGFFLNLGALDGTTGFRWDGDTAADALGDGSASGDINGDGYDDVISWASNRATDRGDLYVIFGKAGAWPASTVVSTLNGTTGFRVDGPAAFDFGGRPAAGDVNKDGFDDLLRGSGNGSDNYVLFGKASGWTATITLSTYVNGTTGFRLDDVNIAQGVAMGDVTGDNYADILVGHILDDNNSRSDSGSTYGVYGRAGTWSSSYTLEGLTVP